MSENKTVFDRVDDVELKVDDVSAKMDNLTAKIDGLLSAKQTKTMPTQTENSQVVLKRFISKAKQEYCWLGSKSKFQKEKKVTITLMFLLVCVLVLSTIFTSIACGLYSPERTF